MRAAAVRAACCADHAAATRGAFCPRELNVRRWGTRSRRTPREPPPLERCPLARSTSLPAKRWARRESSASREPTVSHHHWRDEPQPSGPTGVPHGRHDAPRSAAHRPAVHLAHHPATRGEDPREGGACGTESPLQPAAGLRSPEGRAGRPAHTSPRRSRRARSQARPRDALDGPHPIRGGPPLRAVAGAVSPRGSWSCLRATCSPPPAGFRPLEGAIGSDAYSAWGAWASCTRPRTPGRDGAWP